MDNKTDDNGIAKVTVQFPLGSEGDVRQALADLAAGLPGLEWKEDLSV